MAVPIRLRNIPEYIHSSQFTSHHDTSSDPKHEAQELLQFPKSTCVLWDGTSTGSPVFLHVAQHRKPRLQVWEKVLWLINRQLDNDGSTSRVLVGSLSVDEDAEGVCFHIDGLDTREAGADTSLVLGDVMIPVQVSSSRTQDRTGTVEDYTGAIKMLQKRCCGRDAVELNSLLLVKGWCSFYSNQNSDKTVAHLQFDIVTLATVFKATPVNPVPIVPTALAKNLGGPRSLSHMQGRPKIGYLTMDHTRKLLLVLESDPKVCSLPIVGIWVSGVPMVHHPFVWTSCLRYLHNDQLQDRVCTPPEGFLLVMYTPLHSKPEFYEVCTTSGKSDLEYDLYTGYEITSLQKKSSGPEPTIVEWELCPVRNGPKRELFDAALEGLRSQGPENSSGTASPAPSFSDDIMPRMTPAPHQAKAMVIKPMVPEVSMIWNDDNSPSPALSMQPPFSSVPNRPPCLNTAFSAAPTLAPASRSSSGPMPSSVNGYPASSCMSVGSKASNYCVSRGGQQSSECMPRASVPSQHLQIRTVLNQNGCAGTPCPGVRLSVPSAGFVGTSLPQPSSLQHSHPQPLPVSQYNNGSYPPYQSQGHPMPAAHQDLNSHPRMAFGSVAHQGFQSQPQSHPTQPRLTAPTAMHFCRPSQPGPSVRPGSLPHPSHGGLVQQHHNIHPQHPSAQAQPQYRAPPSLQQTHGMQSASWPSQLPVYTDQGSMPHSSVAGHMSQSRPASNGQFFQKAFPSTNPYPQGIPPHSPQHPQGTVPHSQGTVPHIQSQTRLPCKNNVESSNPQSWQQMSDPARGYNVHPHPSSSQSHPVISYAQPSAAEPPHLNPQGQLLQGHGVSAGDMIGLPDKVTHHGLAAQNGSDSAQANSTSCSGKSSDDSGLSVTPDRSNPSPKPPTSPLTSMAVEGASALGLNSVNWAGVPSEVVQLLVQQDAQLKAMQAQIQQLLIQQQQGSSLSPASTTPTPTPTPSSADSTPSTLKRETCSTAVNTTLGPQSPWGRPAPAAHCVSIQTSPQKPASPFSHNSPNSPKLASPHDSHASPQKVCSPFRHDGTTHATEGQLQRGSAPHTPYTDSAGQTPSDIRHQGSVPLSSTHCEDGAAAAGGSAHSSLSLERPSPTRSMESQLQASHSTPSPQSASMCVCPDGDEGEDSEEISPYSKEYYDQLINNIRLFLNSHSQDAEDSEANKTETAPDDQTCTRLKLLDSTLAVSPSLPACPSGGASSNTTLMPTINYLSMMLGSESDASLEINAMAMKYLRDEQLTQMARLHQSPQRTRGTTQNQLLRQVLAASLDATGASDVSRLGISATNLSMASRKYMEKYGLMGDGGEGESMLDTNHTLRLQTDFSLAVLSEPCSDPSLPPSPQKATHQCSPHPAGARSPVKREKLQPMFQPSPAIVEERENSYGESNRRGMEDLGASPALRPPHPRHFQHRDPSLEDTPIFPERYRNAREQDLINDCSVVTEDDPILDIEKLKQMPKLL